MKLEEIKSEDGAKILFSGIICPCEKRELLCSLHTHDYRTCSCEKAFIDGGREYLRCGIEGDDLSSLTRACILLQDQQIVLKLGDQEFKTKKQ